MEPATNDILRDRGLALQAIACVDAAIWDVFGRALGLPLHRVWGSTGDTVPISVIGGYYHLSIDEMADGHPRLRRRRVRRHEVQGRRPDPGRGCRPRPRRPRGARARTSR